MNRVVGLALMFYYRALGLVAILGLSVFGSLLLTVISLTVIRPSSGTT